MKLNNLKIRTKLAIIYIICVLLPMIATNCFVLSSIKQSVRKEQRTVLKDTADSIQYDINECISNILLVSDYLSADAELNSFVTRTYANNMEYYDSYYKLMHDNVIRYYYTTQSVYNVTILTSNATITNGTYFEKKINAADKDWYKAYRRSGKDIFLCAYFDCENVYAKYIARAKYISVIRKMEESDAILKVDIDYVDLIRRIKSESGAADVYILDDDTILYSTCKSSTTGYLTEADYEPREMEYEKSFPILNEEWTIRVTADESSVTDAFLKNGFIVALLLCINLVIPSVVIVLINRSFSERITLTEKYIKKVEQEQFEEIVCYEGGDEIGNLIRSYNMMVVKIKELIEVVYRKNVEQQALQISRKQAELNALQSQINPHFMFNTLESIRMRSLVKQEMETAKVLEEFATIMRRVIQWDKDFVTLREESETVQSYLDIQKYRFGERLSYHVHIQEDCLDRKIPKFGLLNFVENACVHGIERSIEGGSITVVVSKDEEFVYLEIMDSGSGMDERGLKELQDKVKDASIEDLNQSKSIGILNTVVRLKLYYDGNVRIEINSTEGEGTEVCVVLPLAYNENLKNS